MKGSPPAHSGLADAAPARLSGLADPQGEARAEAARLDEAAERTTHLLSLLRGAAMYGETEHTRHAACALMGDLARDMRAAAQLISEAVQKVA